jgi:hypothetical protein
MDISVKAPLATDALDTEGKMSSIIFVQQHYINKLEEESNEYVKSLGEAIRNQNSENEFGIIVDNIAKFLMNNYTTNTADYTTSNLFSDIICETPAHIDTDISYNGDNIHELVLFSSLTIDEYDIVTVCCCDDSCIIVPNSYDIKGINALRHLHKRLLDASRVDDESLGFLCKNCGCS